MKIYRQSASSLFRRGAVVLLWMMIATASAVAPKQMRAQQASATAKPSTVEWVYRVKYGYKDEWWAIFKKYQLAILDRQKQLGYVKDYTVWAP